MVTGSNYIYSGDGFAVYINTESLYYVLEATMSVMYQYIF